MHNVDEKFIAEVEETLDEVFKNRNAIEEHNFLKVLHAMQEEKLADRHFHSSSGYGYGDEGREKIESVYARIFSTEAALVRTGFVNGTHAISVGLRSIISSGETMIAVTGRPYDTILNTIGLSGTSKLSLIANGVIYKEVSLRDDDSIDIDAVLNELDETTKVIYVQRSSGYSFRKAVDIASMTELFAKVKEKKSDVIIMVDNCYGEFVEKLEPTDVGADLIAGSLIKNPGGSLALSGGYLAGKKDLIELCAETLTAPGIGGECGLTFGTNRNVLQGIFMAPAIVNSAVKGAIFASKVYQSLGYEVNPKPDDVRSDIIQCINLETRERVINFCEKIQAASPVDSFVVPEPWAMPGYDCDVIMAAGTFVQGSSIELSADAPMREPYSVYFQGGISYYHIKYAIISTLKGLL